MALLQVRNFPDDRYEVISRMARDQRRSIAQQTVLLIERGLESGDDISRRQRAIERTMAREVPDWMKGIDTAALIREDRDR